MYYSYEFYISIFFFIFLAGILAIITYNCFIQPVISWLKYKIKSRTEKEVPFEEVEKWINKIIEDEQLFQMFKDAAEGKFADLPPLGNESYVRVTYPCTDPERKHCVAWPDRCEDCGGDGEICSTLINLNKLCNIDSPVTATVKLSHDNDITEEMSKQLAEYILKLQEANSNILKSIWH